jgi:quinol monooxygenase YgiN
MPSPLIVIAQLDAKPEFAAQFRAALEPLIAATLQEPGCLRVSIHRNSIDTGKMRRSSLDPTFLLA